MASGVVAHWEANGMDIVGDHYTHIVRPELGDYMTLSDYRGKTVTTYRLHDSCLGGEHYFAYRDAPGMGADYSYFYFVKGNTFVTVTDLSSGSKRKESALHEKCQGGDFYLATSKYYTLSSSPVFIVIFAKSGTFRAVADLSSGKPSEILQYDGREEYKMHPSCRNGLYYWCTKSHWGGKVWYYIVKGVDEWGRLEFHYTKDLCTDEEGATETYEPTVTQVLSGSQTAPTLNPWTGDLSMKPPTEGHLTVRAVQNELWTIRYKWQKIGIELDFQLDELKSIQSNYGNDDKCLPELIDKWLKRSQPKASWEVLVQVLKKPQVGEEGIADDISQKYLR